MTSGFSAIHNPWLRIAVGLSLLWIFVFAIFFPRLLMPTAAATGYDQQDYIAFHGAARAALAQTLPNLYSPRVFWEWMEVKAILYWLYPPTILAVIAPLGTFTYPVAKAVFAWISFMATYATAAQATGNRSIALLAVFGPTSFVSLWTGQISAVFALLLTTGLFTSQKHPVLSGLCFGLLTMKPHYGVLVIPFLIVQRAWIAIVVALGTTAALVLGSLALYGITPWQEFIASLGAGTHSQFLLTGGHPARITFLDTLHVFGLGSEASLLFYLPLIALAIIGQKSLAHRPPTHLIAFTLAATVAVSPYAFTYDFHVVATAILIAAVAIPNLALPAALVLIIVWFAPIVPFFQRGLDFMPALLWPCTALTALIIYRAQFLKDIPDG